MADDSAVAYQRLSTGLMVQRSSSAFFEGDATLLASSVGLFKNIVGAGLLSLPAGIAAASDMPDYVWLAVLLAGLLGLLSAYCFWTLSRVCVATGATTYAQAFARVYGAHWERLVDALIVVKTGAACILYQILLAGLAQSVSKQLGAPEQLTQRSVVLWGITVCILLPLGLAKSFAALARFAALGCLGVLYSTAFMCLRWEQGAYDVDGRFYEDQLLKPSFGQREARPVELVKLMSMFGTAYICHFNAPRFAHELERNTSARLGQLTALGFGTAFIVMSLAMGSGFLTFGGSCMGNILENYAANDKLVVPARVGILVSVLFGFPFIFAAFRDGVMEFISPAALEHMHADGNFKVWSRGAVSIVLLACTTMVATEVQDLGFAVALIGALMASNVVYTLPGLAFVGFVKDFVKSGRASKRERLEYWINWCIVVFGVLLCLQGTFVTVAGKLAGAAAGPE